MMVFPLQSTRDSLLAPAGPPRGLAGQGVKVGPYILVYYVLLLCTCLGMSKSKLTVHTRITCLRHTPLLPAVQRLNFRNILGIQFAYNISS